MNSERTLQPGAKELADALNGRGKKKRRKDTCSAVVLIKYIAMVNWDGKSCSRTSFESKTEPLQIQVFT